VGERVKAAKTEGAVSLHSTEWLRLQLLRHEAQASILDFALPANPFAN
jgi:hypothetical protein